MVSFLSGLNGSRLAYVRTSPSAPPPPRPAPRAPGILFCPGLLSDMQGCGTRPGSWCICNECGCHFGNSMSWGGMAQPNPSCPLLQWCPRRTPCHRTKALALEAFITLRLPDCSYLRFDYRGHGQSSGAFKDTHLGDWWAGRRSATNRPGEGAADQGTLALIRRQAPAAINL
jgi:hypothetical protein